MLGARREWTQGLVRILAVPFVALRIPPNVITVLGPILAFIPAALEARHSFLWAGFAVAAVSLVDTIDGAVARARDRVTAFGGYLDSVVDRVSDAVLLFGIWFGMADRGWWVVIAAALIGQSLTSYARARAYQDTRPDPSVWNDVFERPERIIFLSLVLVVQGLLDGLGVRLSARTVPGVPDEEQVLFWGLALFAIMSLATAARRVYKVRGLLAESQK